MAKIIYEVYQNQNTHSTAFGKFYARVKYLENLNTRKLSNHIAEHGSIYTPDVVYGVMEKFRSCLLEMLLESKRVKIEGLGTFYATIECSKGGAVSKDKFNVQKNIEGLHIRFLPEQEQETNISSRQFLKQAEFVNVDSLLKKEEETQNGGDSTGGNNSGSGTNSGSENQGGSQGENGQNQQNQTTDYALTISKSGTGSASVTHNGNAVASGSNLSEDDEVEISITPAEGQTPTATINGSSIELTEDGGVYSGSFAMPGQASTLVINTGTSGGDDDHNPIDTGN